MCLPLENHFKAFRIFDEIVKEGKETLSSEFLARWKHYYGAEWPKTVCITKDTRFVCEKCGDMFPDCDCKEEWQSMENQHEPNT